MVRVRCGVLSFVSAAACSYPRARPGLCELRLRMRHDTFTASSSIIHSRTVPVRITQLPRRTQADYVTFMATSYEAECFPICRSKRGLASRFHTSIDPTYLNAFEFGNDLSCAEVMQHYRR